MLMTVGGLIVAAILLAIAWLNKSGGSGSSLSAALLFGSHFML